MFVALLTASTGWMLAPRNLTIHNPPDLRSGSTKKWWEVPPSTVYSFAFYIFQQLNAWPKDGEVDYPAKIAQRSPFLTPACQDFLNKDAEFRTNSGELKDRVRVIYEIPKRGYSSKSVEIKSEDEWVTALLGRVPIDGKVTDPYPFKVLIGKDNLTANGIDLPDVQGAVVAAQIFCADDAS